MALGMLAFRVTSAGSLARASLRHCCLCSQWGQNTATRSELPLPPQSCTHSPLHCARRRPVPAQQGTGPLTIAWVLYLSGRFFADRVPPRPHRDEPVSLALQEDHSSQMDRYLVYGDKYKSLRDAVGKAVLECKPLAIAAAVKVGRPLPPRFPRYQTAPQSRVVRPRPPRARPKQEDVSNRVRGQICLTSLTRPVGAIISPYVTAHIWYFL